MVVSPNTGPPTSCDVTPMDPVPERPWNTEHQLQLLVESLKDYAIFLLDPEGRVVSWNGGAERIT